MGYLTYSIILNILLCGTYVYIKWTDYNANNLNWTRKAAKQAEEVASISCSGHGLAYLDSSVVDGKQVCECYACYAGSDCSDLSFPCLADADSGNPLFLEPFWKKQRENSSVLISGWHRLGYSYPVGGHMSVELEKYIFKLHELVGNAVTKGRRIVFGTGSTQLLNAAVHSLASFSPIIPAQVLVSIPHYPLYESQTNYFTTRNYEFKGDVLHWKNKSDGERMSIEFVTSPNNPDGKLNQKVLNGPLAKAIHDHVYYWPHYTAIPAPADEDVMLFSVSKLTGHAGSRFGWALVKDESVHRKMKDYVNYISLGISHDTQLRILELLKFVVDGGGKELFQFGQGTMKDRWERLNAVFSKSPRFSLQVIPPQFCSYYQRVRQPSPAYAWLKCERNEDKDCYAVLKSAGIIGRKGRLFGAGDRYVRLSLLKSKDDFELLMQNVQLLIKTELEIYPGYVSSVLFLEPFWKKQRENSSVLISGWHRLGYSYPVGGHMSVELEKYIFKLHELVGNAVTKGRRIVFGTGSTQLLNAAVHSLASFSPVIPALVLVSVPYYPTNYFATRNYEFKGDVSVWKNKSDGERMSIEFVTSPNNPDGKLNQKLLNGPLAKAIHDHVYYWPHYTAIPAPADEDIMLFSVSKLTGHAGSRFGWALVKDESVHRKMKHYVDYNSFGVSHDTQLRILELLKVVVDGGGKELFQFGHGTMKDRWERLNAVFSKSSRFSLQVIPPQFCTYYQQVRQPSPAYAWLKCERNEDKDCYAVLKSAGIIGRKGRLFGAGDRYVRLSVLKSKDDFELLMQNLQLLIKTELEIYPGYVSSG